MQPRVFKRWNTVAAVSKSRKGRKSRPPVTPAGPPPPPSPEEDVRITQRRHRKAERDERMDITRALTPSKTYMGGFTRPKDFRAANWFPGGTYIQKGKIYESPPEAAYEPHTVFLLETRYNVRHGTGRVDSREHVTAVCRAPDFVKLMAKYNSLRCPPPALESLDNACWPFVPNSGKVLSPTIWWGPDENLEDIMREIYEGDDFDKDAVQKVLSECAAEADEEVGAVEEQKPAKRRTPAHTPESSQSSPLPPPTATSPTDESQAHTSASPTSNDIQPASPSQGSQEGPSTQPPGVEASSSFRATPPHLLPQFANQKILDPEILRAQYGPRLATEPFWRPLLAITVSTRPLALSLVRLARAMERGHPFYAAMSNDDRKCLHSFGSRMTNYRLNRFLELTREMVMRLAGYKGGFIGIRFGVNCRGRGIDGEGLADPIPLDKRIVKVQVGRWYQRAEEVYESFEQGGREWGGNDAVNVSFMNDWGRTLDIDGKEVPLTAEEMSPGDAQEAEDNEHDEPDEIDEGKDYFVRTPVGDGKKKLKRVPRGADEASIARRRELALVRAQKHYAVAHV